MKWCPWQDSHPHSTASETVVSAVGLHGHLKWQPRVDCRSCGCAASASHHMMLRCRAQRSHHQPCASKAHALQIELRGYFLKWSVRLDSHQHLPGYEPDALTVKLQTKNGRIPRCCPGPVLVPNQVSSLALSYPMKLDVRPGLAPGNVDLRTTGSTTSPCARLKLGFSVGAAPTPSLPQREVLLLHHEKHLKGCGMSVLPRRALFGKQTCLLLHQCRETGRWSG